MISLMLRVLTGAFHAGLLDGLLGVAGTIMKIVMKWVIPSFPT